MDDLPKILLGILIGALIVGGAVMFFSHSGDNPMNETNDSVSEVAQEQVNTVNNGGNDAAANANATANTNANSNAANSGSSQGNQNGVSGGEVTHNYQGDGWEMYQINYNDGNFRQYDTKTGELVGSSFDEDQEKLGVVDGDLV